ncbi:helix-turn-helix transcriptional regulator [Pseudonocardia sp. KRD-184]|uniref:Helix-turn-helix transcriptional regulator n=3 Tax=Pseudonocardia oceani TaxID=2792013 RepID=A0ABS6U805_9PSEU|nr:helix-turn-helix transcriptional regulator [Pseudonocardia oceani]MBW0099833.1 helix-turn-helix transcriptional regulator [Pseudonocardia oceani]MBW0125022.1 helix-turn-helix transcriptional regulator [Pseudonocardia oceani]MBW0128128.1 helix-turn-helix transcriptional regulator [Pseudonocardia oceani]
MTSGDADPPGGATLARWVSDHPRDPLVAGVLGPGGTGKSMLLDVLAGHYAAAGVTVHRSGPRDPAVSHDVDGVVLVDDAHLLDRDRIDALHALVRSPGARVVMAHRPWPRPDGLTRLCADVGARRVVAVVGHLGRRAVADRVAQRLGAPAPERMVELVHTQSGGLPALVDLVAQGLIESGLVDARQPARFRAPERITVSVALAERLRHRVDALPAPVQELLTAMAHGATLDSDVLAQLLDQPVPEFGPTVEAARATGLLTDTGTLIPLIGALFLRLTPALRTHDLHRRLATLELARGGSVLAAGRRLLGTGAGGGRIAEVLVAAAEEAAAESSSLCAELLEAAVDAGRPQRELAGRRSHALALEGDLTQALRHADATLADPHAPDRHPATLAAAAALAHRGLPGRSVELLRTLPASSAVLAVPGLLSLGRIDEARATLDAAEGTDGPGTLLEGSATMIGRGMVGTVIGSTAALSRLAQATAMLEPVAGTSLLPDTPAALTAVVATLSGQPTIAESTLRRAIEGRHGGRVAVLRHRLLLGWVLMCRGTLDPPTALVGRVLRQETPPDSRDALLAAALDIALARRRDDGAAMGAAWDRARDALLRQPVDLTLVPVLGELSVAAEQIGEAHWLAGQAEDLDDLLDRLGRPALWTAPTLWWRLQAAVVAGRHDEVAGHATALGRLAASSPYTEVLAAAAACWSSVLDGSPEVCDVIAVGRRMETTGLVWEAAQLAGRAAAASADRRAAQSLHAFARSLGSPADPAPVTPAADVPAPQAPDPTFTERELEIGRLILDGLTYKQIGTRLFIAAKTVEHYVARMRQRLGVATRNELFALLQTALEEPAARPEGVHPEGVNP